MELELKQLNFQNRARIKIASAELIKRIPGAAIVNGENFSIWFFSAKRKVSFVNPVNYMLLIDNKEILCGIDYYFFDGQLAQRWIGWLRSKDYARISFDFTSVALQFFKYCEKNNKTLYILGATESELINFTHLLMGNFPNLKIVGYNNGYFQDNDFELIKDQIKVLQPDVVICGLGCPKQELISAKIGDISDKISTITCGGFIHQTQTKLQYYPSWINRLNLRMPYRFIKEPHTRKRFWYYPEFLLLTLLTITR